MWVPSETKRPFPALSYTQPFSNHPVSDVQLAVKDKWRELLNSVLLWACPAVILQLQPGQQFAGGWGLGKDGWSLVALHTWHLQISPDHLPNGSARAVQPYKPGLASAHAMTGWRGALGRARRPPQREHIFLHGCSWWAERGRVHNSPYSLQLPHCPGRVWAWPASRKARMSQAGRGHRGAFQQHLNVLWGGHCPVRAACTVTAPLYTPCSMKWVPRQTPRNTQGHPVASRGVSRLGGKAAKLIRMPSLH